MKDRMRGVAPRTVVRVLAIVLALVGLWLLVQSPVVATFRIHCMMRRNHGRLIQCMPQVAMTGTILWAGVRPVLQLVA